MKQETLSAKLKSILSLDFDPEEWQLTVIQRILQRYSVIFTGGTSYGKSLIFEGVAAMSGKKRVCIVVTPLKALERDHVKITPPCARLVTESVSYVQEATKKGLTAVMINEDNSLDNISGETAALPTEAFNVVWDKLDDGHRPFFGADAGTDRSNLLFLARPVENPDDPARD
ncbi:hypothetical protein FRC01_002814, partial [Tulasnella sp. 417]